MKDALMSAGSAEQTIRAFTLRCSGSPLSGGCPRRPMQPGCRRNGCLRLSSLGLALLGLMFVIIFVNLICFGHYARVFPDMRCRKFDSVMFAIGLPVMVARHDFVWRGRVEFHGSALGFRYHRVRLGDTPRRGGMSVRRPRVRARRWRTLALGCRRAVNEADGGDRARKRSPPRGRKAFHFAMPPRQRVMYTAGNGPDRTRGAGAIVEMTGARARER